MKFRISSCAPLEAAPIVAENGGMYVEPGFAVVTMMTPEQYREKSAILRSTGLRALAMNSMLPGNFKLYGDANDDAAVCDFVKAGMDRAEELGCEVVVMGSGTARNIPEGLTRAQASERLAALLGKFCEIAAPHHIKIAVEPLRAEETNFIHTVSDAAELIRYLPECRNLGINPDLYHMLCGNEPLSDLVRYRDHVFHAHMCRPDRYMPVEHNEEEDAIYESFMRTLDEAGYHAEISIEGISKSLADDLPRALPLLRSIAERI